MKLFEPKDLADLDIIFGALAYGGDLAEKRGNCSFDTETQPESGDIYIVGSSSQKDPCLFRNKVRYEGKSQQ